MDTSRGRVSLSRQHLQRSKVVSPQDGFGVYNDSGVSNNIVYQAYTSHRPPEEGSDALRALDKLGMQRKSSIGESLEILDDITDDDRSSPTETEEYNEDSTTDESSYDVYEFSNDCEDFRGGFSDDPLNDTLAIYEYHEQQYKHSNSGRNSQLSEASTICLATENNVENSQYCNTKNFDNDKEYHPKEKQQSKSYCSYVGDTEGGGSSGESGCDTEDTVKAVSDDEEPDLPFKGNNTNWGLKLEFSNRDNLESGFTEDYTLNTPSVYEEEAVINIPSDSYNNNSYSDSDAEEEVNKFSQNGFMFNLPETNSSFSHSTNYPQSELSNNGDIETCEESSCSILPASYFEDQKSKKTQLKRRPHIKASQSPLLRRRQPGEQELEIVRSQKSNLEESEEESDESSHVVENDAKSYAIKSRFSFINHITNRREAECALINTKSSDEVQMKYENTSQREDSHMNYCATVGRTIASELCKTKWNKTKEQVMDLLRERLVVLKKVIQDKNCQIRQLKTRLKEEQQNSQAIQQKLKVRLISHYLKRSLRFLIM